MNEQPTKEQIKEFWEGHGVREATISGNYDDWVLDSWGMSWKSYKQKKGTVIPLPPIDLNNLFEYAVPIAVKKIMLELRTDYDDALHSLIHDWMKLMRGKKDPALALFWTVHGALI